ncbi:related to Sentrin-specific protease 1 [Sporisorium reilianum f. sp. reilianum]|uniref:Related to Sentrin-specific protease 1 n=1 Tax=Sporisorium reilianum f. sp. reilianum TaxID=72559 RepID=A0A2N8U5Q3_9BASI|nr:related to Sentrin-specific protease 1 [Sporisorium reilianum f. sp. reilianum]
MPLKRGRSALDTLSQTSEASSSSSSASAVVLNGTSIEKPTNSTMRRFTNLISNALSSSSRKRQKLIEQPNPHGRLLLSTDTMTPEPASSSSPASGFVDLTPSKTPFATAEASTSSSDTRLLLSSQEGAIRDPLGRTSLSSSPSPSPSAPSASALMTDTRSSSEQAAEKQIQHPSPPSSPPATPLNPANMDLDLDLKPESQPEPDLEAALDPPPTQDESIITDSQSDRPVDDADNAAEQTGPTDADVDHIQALAHAKVGEHIEGLLDWSRSLSSTEPNPPIVPASNAGDRAITSPDHDQDAVATNDSGADTVENPSAEVVDLVSDSDDSNSENEDPDKENDVSRVNATPRLDSDVSLSSFPAQRAAQEATRASSSRHSFIGPLAQKFQRKQRHDPQAKSRFSFAPAQANASEPGDMSATEEVRSIGRQSRFFQPTRRSAPQHSTPLPNERPSRPDRSFSFSSNTSIPSVSAISTKMPSSTVYRKRNPIYSRKHSDSVELYREHTIKLSIDRALRSINNIRSSARTPLLHPKQFHELAVKTQMVHALLAEDNPKHAQQADFLSAMTQKFMRQRQRDAETAVLPVSQVKLHEKERLEKEMKARERKIRGILGRKPLPAQMDEKGEEGANSAFIKKGVVSDTQGAQVSDFDVAKLRPRQWLNDEVINFYGTLILNRANEADKKRTEAMAAAKDAPAPPETTAKGTKKGKPQRPYDRSLDAFWRVHFFNSFFWSNLKKRGHDSVKRWTRRIDIFSKDIILFPINVGNAHWVCGAINMRKHRFEYYDSLGAFNQSAFELMRDYVVAEARDKLKKDIDLRGWTDHFSDESPQQENNFDCGVFASQTLEQLSRRDYHTPIPLSKPAIVWKGGSLDEGAEKLSLGGEGAGADGEEDDDDEEYEWNFGQQNMPYLRRRMAYEIYSKQLLD